LKWEATLNPPTDGVWAVQVSGTDTQTNSSSIGNTLATTDFPTSKSIVFYTDSGLPAATVTPADASSPTISVPFFLVVDYSAENKEYGLTSGGALTTTVASISTDLDVNAVVTLTAATLDGVDILSLFETQDDETFTAPILDITTGDHTLVFSGMDAAGNEEEDREITFTVKARSAYKVPMNAGWNLVSFPGTPIDSDITAVVPPSHPATDILAFDDGVWMVATRVSGGAWDGTLSTIDGQHGYWVNTTSSQPLSSLLALPSVGNAATLPSVPVEQGWNLLPVIDLAQGSAVTTTVPANNYFTSLDWAVAYTYDSATRTWTRVIGATTVANGQGVWLWANQGGTLIP
jgi:hypothetical protein